MADAQVELVGVTKRFGDNRPAVDDVALRVPRGSFTTLLGPSGCGKTTLLRLIAGLYEPDAGDILLAGRRINGVPAHRRRTAMVFQDYALFPHMSVFDNVAYGLKLAGLDRDQIRKRVDETLAFLGLGGLEARSPSRLSGGQQQRVALARALVVQPEVLLLDEPLSNLDAKLRVRIRDELSSIQRQLGLTTVYVTHDQDEALAMSDWIAVMEHGRIVQWGTPSEIYYQPRSAFVADFVGTVNLVPARIISADLERLTVELGGERLTLPRPSVAPTAGQVTLAIRPESLALAAGSDTATGPTLRGSIVRHSFLGHLTRYVVRVGDQEWLVDQHDPGPGPARGGEVLLRLDLARIHVLPGG